MSFFLHTKPSFFCFIKKFFCICIIPFDEFLKMYMLMLWQPQLKLRTFLSSQKVLSYPFAIIHFPPYFPHCTALSELQCYWNHYSLVLCILELPINEILYSVLFCCFFLLSVVVLRSSLCVCILHSRSVFCRGTLSPHEDAFKCF